MESKPIKIAHLVNYLSPAGKEVGIVKLLNAIDSTRFAPVLIVLEKVYDSLGLDLQKTRVIEIGKKEGNDFSLIGQLKRLFRQEQIDIVHTHAWGTLVEGILSARLARVPVIIHGEHGTFHRDLKRRLVQRLFFALSDQVLAVSGVLADDLSKTIGIKRSKIHTILNGVDIKRFAPSAQKRAEHRSKLGFADDQVIIGTVGRPMKVKNHQLMIRALPDLIKENPLVHFVIVGDTPKYSLREELEELAKSLKVREHVHFLGFQTDIPGLLNAFDIFVLPSLSEGCSNVLQEAMATGLPIVASRVGGNPELIDHQQNGLLFTSNSVEELVNALRWMINNPEKAKQLGQKALHKARTMFSMEKMIKDYEDVYLKWMEKKNAWPH